MTTILLVLLLLFVGIANAGCPTGTVYNSMNNICYKFSKDQLLTFVDAEYACSELNGHLASAQNAFINLEIQSNAYTFFGCTTQSYYWLGGTVYGSSWQWTDQTKWSYTNWAPGQGLNTSVSQCLSASVSYGQWFSSGCDIAKAFVCAIPPTDPVCPTLPTSAPTPSYLTAPCEDEWIHYNGTGYCYKVLHNQNFTSAEKKCVTVGAHLTSIHSLLENDFIQRITATGYPIDMSQFYVWIGLKLNSNNQWVWTDGTPLDYDRWYNDQPRSGYNCAYFMPEAGDAQYADKWFAYTGCDTVMRAFVCKKKALY